MAFVQGNILSIGVHVNPHVVYDGNNVKFWIPHILYRTP
jgi:hypothetical protein